MKRKLAIIAISAIACILASCAPSKQEVQTKEAVTQEVQTAEAETETVESATGEASEEETYTSMWMSNPWVDSDKDGVLEATGFDIPAPEGAANVAYSYMPDTGMAQLNFTMDNAMWVYRMQPTEALEDISGIYCDWTYVGETKVSGMDAMEYIWVSEQEGDFIDDIDGTQVINWFDAEKKVTHSLCVMGKDLNGLDIAVFAGNEFG